MSIPFTQYLRPTGKKVQVEIDRHPDVERDAYAFINSGGYFECEELTTGHASLTAGHLSYDEGDVAIEVVLNGPDVPAAVDRLVEKACKWLRTDHD